eukprot:403360147
MSENTLQISNLTFENLSLAEIKLTPGSYKFELVSDQNQIQSVESKNEGQSRIVRQTSDDLQQRYQDIFDLEEDEHFQFRFFDKNDFPQYSNPLDGQITMFIFPNQQEYESISDLMTDPEGAYQLIHALLDNFAISREYQRSGLGQRFMRISTKICLVKGTSMLALNSYQATLDYYTNIGYHNYASTFMAKIFQEQFNTKHLEIDKTKTSSIRNLVDIHYPYPVIAVLTQTINCEQGKGIKVIESLYKDMIEASGAKAIYLDQDLFEDDSKLEQARMILQQINGLIIPEFIGSIFNDDFDLTRDRYQELVTKITSVLSTIINEPLVINLSSTIFEDIFEQH